MQLILLSLVLFFLTCNNAVASKQKWATVIATEKDFQVDMPISVKKSTTPIKDQQARMFKAQDENTVYVAFGMTLADHAKDLDYQVKDGLSGLTESKGQSFEQKDARGQGWYGRRIDISAHGKQGTMLIALANDAPIAYMLTVSRPSKDTDSKRFIESLVVNSNAAAQYAKNFPAQKSSTAESQDEDKNSPVFWIGYLLGTVIALGIPTLIIVSLVKLVKKLGAKK